MSRTILRCFRNMFLQTGRRSPTLNRHRLLQHEQLEPRYLLTLPASLIFAEGDTITYNGPTVDLVNDTLSFDAFIDFAGDTDSYFFAPQFTGTYTIDVGDFGNTVDPEVAVYIANTGQQVGYNDDLSSVNDDARLVLNLTADVRYIIAVADNPATTAGNLSIIVSAPFRTGSFLIVPDAFGDATASAILDVPTDIDYYSITAPADATGVLTISASGSTFNQRLALFNSAGTLLQGPLVAINISNVNPSQEYRIAVFSSNFTSSGSLQLHVNFAQSGAVVSNTADAGPGSLRQAILDANAHPNVSGEPDKIRFAIPGVGPHIISLTSALPDITEAVDIDGGTQPGTGATPTVAISGAALTGGADGLRILADGTSIRKLNIRQFPSDGIQVQANFVLLQDNTIGTDAGGVAAFGNGNYGIRIQNRSNNQIRSNVLSGNVQGGIFIFGNAADGNILDGNTIGARFGGNTPLPNANGVVVTDGDSNVISNNVISGNTLSGIFFSGSSNTNSVTGNKIGAKSLGNAALPNGGDGILIQSSGNTIGGNLAASRNVISGNAKTGITISGVAATNNVIEGNRIGTNLNGNAAVPNAGDGIRVVNASNNRIGSATDALARNVISGNTGSGVTFSQAGSTGGVLFGNFIGVASNGTSALGNSGNGVLLTAGATNVKIGGSTGLSRNIVSANGAHGISISAGSNTNRITRNRIGTTSAGAPLGNTGSGIFIQSSGNTIGGVNVNAGNIIAGNVQGITFSGAGAVTNKVSFNTIGTDTASNTGRGIQFVSGASRNTVGPGNTIRRNETGILVSDGSIRNKITQNSIGENINLGIDLLPAPGATANDAADADGGANLKQNWPAIAGSPLLIGADVEITFRVQSSPTNSAYPLTIEFFVSDGGGEGAQLLGSTLYTEANFAAGDKTISFTGAGAGLTVGTTKIVATATDLNGNTSEFSTQRTLASGGARLSTATRDSGNQLDVNDNGVVNSADAVELINFLNRTDATDGRGIVVNSVAPALRYDVSGDGMVSPLDVLLVVRGLRKNSSANQSVPSVKQLEDEDFWNSVLNELDQEDLTAIKPALLKSKWLKLS